MTWWHALVLGLVEGITEYLPISSTGHLILASALLGLDDPRIRSSVDAYLIVVQGGAILAVLLLYRERVREVVQGLLGRSERGRNLLANLAVAFLPAAVLGPPLDDVIDAWLFRPWPVLAALFLGGLWMIRLGAPRSRRRLRLDDMRWQTALGIGLFQAAAMWPGTSRSMMTIAGGLVLGLGMVEAAEFSFLLGLPTLGAACALKLLKDREAIAALGAGPVLLGIAVATLSAAAAVHWLVGFLHRRGLAPFGWYRIALAGVLGVLLLTGMVRLG